ncbi:MAG TPA: RepB family plasmid replication initiator protein [Hymenobacter sp.]|uniref:RepB family plasmid replication initiator protein n=1 Tax=Hymenobacter sp. TaxID=1898978 RepID=UPI002ED97934
MVFDPGADYAKMLASKLVVQGNELVNALCAHHSGDADADHSSGEQSLVVRFNDRVREHLLQLNEGHFTQAQLLQLLKLKSAHSYRIIY